MAEDIELIDLIKERTLITDYLRLDESGSKLTKGGGRPRPLILWDSENGKSPDGGREGVPERESRLA